MGEFLKEIKERLGEHDPSQIDELVLDELFNNINEFTNDHRDTLQLYKNLLHLSLNGLGLRNLNNFPKIETLEVLEIRQNNLTGKNFEQINDFFPKLYKLKVGENPISSLDAFKSLSNTQIKKIELKNTEASENSSYNNKLFDMIPSLISVDNLDKKGGEVETTLYEDEDEEGEFGMSEEDEFEDMEQMEGGEFEEEFEDEEGEFDEDFDDEDEEDEVPKKKK